MVRQLMGGRIRLTAIKEAAAAILSIATINEMQRQDTMKQTYPVIMPLSTVYRVIELITPSILPSVSAVSWHHRVMMKCRHLAKPVRRRFRKKHITIAISMSTATAIESPRETMNYSSHCQDIRGL